MHKPHIPLEQIRTDVEACRRCPLADGRTQTVFGDGNPDARVLIVGEAPGKNEDLQGIPFVGAAGKYLNELLAIAGLKREDVFIANVLKCRPPGNRDPRPEEIELCTPYLREQTRTIDPEFIVTLGNFSTKFILKTEVGITRLHGKLQQAGRFKVFPIFHPAAALYDGSKRVALEDDFATLGELLRQSAQAAGAADAGSGRARRAGWFRAGKRCRNRACRRAGRPAGRRARRPATVPAPLRAGASSVAAPSAKKDNRPTCGNDCVTNPSRGADILRHSRMKSRYDEGV